MSTVFHRVKAQLYENLLTDDPNDYVARVSSEKSLGIKELCALAVERGGADISAASMQHAVELFFKEMGYNLCDGFSVNTGFFTASPLIRGVFNSATEPFTPGKHSILFLFNQGEALRSLLPSVQVEITGIAETGLNVVQVVDVRTGSVNDQLTPNRNLKVTGYKVKIAGENPANGIAFINEATQEVVAVDPADIVVNNPSELIFVIPALGSGTYRLRVTTQFTIGTVLKEPRIYVFDKLLTVS